MSGQQYTFTMELRMLDVKLRAGPVTGNRYLASEVPQLIPFPPPGITADGLDSTFSWFLSGYRLGGNTIAARSAFSNAGR